MKSYKVAALLAVLLFATAFSQNTFAQSSGEAQSARPGTFASQLRPRTLVLLETTGPLASTDLEEGQEIPLRCRMSVTQNGQIVVAAGAEAEGKIQALRSATESAAAAIEIVPLWAEAADGSRIRFDARSEVFEGFMAGEAFMEIRTGTMLRAFSVGQAATAPAPATPASPAAVVAPGKAKPLVADSSALSETDFSTLASDSLGADSLAFLHPGALGDPLPTGLAEQAEAPSPAPTFLPANTEITLEMDDEIVPAQAAVGQIVRLRVAEDVEIGGQLVLPAQTRAEGRVKHRHGNAFYVEAASLAMPDGQRVPLESRSLKIEFDPEEQEDLLSLEGELRAFTGAGVELGER